MKKLVLLFATALFLVSCSNSPKSAPSDNGHKTIEGVECYLFRSTDIYTQVVTLQKLDKNSLASIVDSFDIQTNTIHFSLKEEALNRTYYASIIGNELYLYEENIIESINR